MKIGGLQKVTLLDFPDLMAAIVFVKGCNFACPFCFNRDLVLNNLPTISPQTVFAFLKKRQKILDGVVISGGEPTIQTDLENFIGRMKKLGYQVKLDTNGSQPEILKKLLEKNLIDYVALDIKGPLNEEYALAIGQQLFEPTVIIDSIKLLLKAKIPFEFRTTIVPKMHDQKILRSMAKDLKKIIGRRKIPWLWQNFQPKNCLDPQFEKKKPFKKEKLAEFLKMAKKFYPEVKLREE
jgi:pyruvate formate lyase activating enzyme